MIEDNILVHAFRKLDAIQVGEAIKKEKIKNWDLFIQSCEVFQKCYNNLKISEDKTHITKTPDFFNLINDRFYPK